MKNNEFSFPSPLAGEVCFRCELTNVRKQGEGYKCYAQYPSSEFLKLVPHFEILPSPARGEGRMYVLDTNITKCKHEF